MLPKKQLAQLRATSARVRNRVAANMELFKDKVSNNKDLRHSFLSPMMVALSVYPPKQLQEMANTAFMMFSPEAIKARMDKVSAPDLVTRVYDPNLFTQLSSQRLGDFDQKYKTRFQALFEELHARLAQHFDDASGNPALMKAKFMYFYTTALINVMRRYLVQFGSSPYEPSDLNLGEVVQPAYFDAEKSAKEYIKQSPWEYYALPGDTPKLELDTNVGALNDPLWSPKPDSGITASPRQKGGKRRTRKSRKSRKSKHRKSKRV